VFQVAIQGSSGQEELIASNYLKLPAMRVALRVGSRT
jgi:hypothetical protein